MSENNKEIAAKHEVEEMFNSAFLPKLHAFSKRIEEQRENDEKIEFYNIQLFAKLLPSEKSWTYEEIINDMVFRIHPITQSDLDKMNEENNESNEPKS